MDSLPHDKTRNILVVDDEEDVCDFLKLFLESLDWDVTVATSIHDAFHALKQREYFLVLTDIAMPEMDGYEFISRIREKNIPSQIVLMTGFGYNPKHTLVKIKKSMGYPCHFKPFNREKLRQSVEDSFATYHKLKTPSPPEINPES